MEIARYWAHASDEVQRPDGRWLSVKCWGWSSDSAAQAEGKAREALERLSARVQQGLDLPAQYGYGTRALREEIIREIGDSGSPFAVVTRNSYGSLILNTSRVMFIDVDVPIPGTASGFLGRLISKTDPAEAALARLRSSLEKTNASFRVYRTAAGFRVLATDPLFEPGSTESEQIMQDAKADPAFVTLCRVQRSFRARLTPKPWRCGRPRPPVPFPRDAWAQQTFNEWLTEYDSVCAAWATCRFLADVGPGRVHEEAQPLLELHDELTRSTSGLSLA